MKRLWHERKQGRAAGELHAYPGGILDGYQNKGVAAFSKWIFIKTKEIGIDGPAILAGPPSLNYSEHHAW
jgi:hypothetical protein